MIGSINVIAKIKTNISYEHLCILFGNIMKAFTTKYESHIKLNARLIDIPPAKHTVHTATISARMTNPNFKIGILVLIYLTTNIPTIKVPNIVLYGTIPAKERKKPFAKVFQIKNGSRQ